MRIALLGAVRNEGGRLARLLQLPIEAVAPTPQRQDVDVVISLRFGAEEARQFHMRLLQLPGAGADAVDFAALPPDCAVCNVYEHDIPLSEYVLLAMLDHAIGFCAMSRDFSRERWGQIHRGRVPHQEIAGKTVGLVGYGHIGRAVAERARAFGMRIHAVTASGRAPLADWSGTPAQLDALLAASDFVVLACPLNEHTYGMIGAAQLRAMKPSAFLINVARGQVVREQDLYDALKTGVIAGATLDVWYTYPTGPQDNPTPSHLPFETLPNVRCTPHSASWTEPMLERRFQRIAENITRLQQGRELLNVIRGSSSR